MNDTCVCSNFNCALQVSTPPLAPQTFAKDMEHVMKYT